MTSLKTRWEQKKDQHGLFIVAGVSSAEGLRSAIDGGADIAIAYHFGLHPTKRHTLLTGMLPFGNANSMVLDMGADLLAKAGNMPLFAGVCAADPFRRMETHLRQLMEIGFAGVNNFPSIGLVDGSMRASLEANNMGFKCEAEMIRQAAEWNLSGIGFTFCENEARRMAHAGAEAIILHPGLITQRMIEQRTAPSLQEYAATAQKTAAVLKTIAPETIILCHGYPLEGAGTVESFMEMAPDVQGILDLSCLSKAPAEALQEMESLRRIKRSYNKMDT